MNKITAILLLIFTGFVNSCSSTDVGEGDTFLWQIKSETAVVYLLGSIHTAKKSLYPLDQRIENAYQKSDNLGVEIDMSALDPSVVTKYMMYEDGRKLKDQISEENYNKLKKIFEKNGLPEMGYAPMKPWAAAMTAELLELSSQGYGSENGIDNHFIKKANEEDKPIKELETPEFQMKLFSKFDNAGDDFIEFTLESINKTDNDVDKMFEAWKSGNTEELQAILSNARNDYPQFESAFKEIIDERNTSMTKTIRSWLTKDESYFVVAGAGHLIGDNGIISQLKKSGSYEIKRY